MGKQIHIHVHDGKTKDGISGSSKVKASVRQALSDANHLYVDASHTQQEGKDLQKIIELLSQCERML